MSELYIGLMSGTSMDAVDAALVDFTQGMRLVGTHSISLPDDLKARLIALSLPGPDEIERLGRTDVELGQLFAKAVHGVLESSEHHAAEIRAIGSHGQTIRHRPQGDMPFTLQISDPNTIAENTGITVIADFRRRDMAAGGQGAPLVPAFHASVFGHESRHRIVLNLGGIANITVLPGGQQEKAYGFDTGPANTLMDAWSQFRRGIAYDAGGEWAASGDVNAALLQTLLAHPYFSRSAPKSTGREDFNLAWLEGALAAQPEHIADVDVQATLLELTANSIALAIQKAGLSRGELLLCGGGAFNNALWHRLQALLHNWTLQSTADFGLAPGWVEAAAFAWLARQTLLGQPGNLPAVTGADGPRILGGIYPA